MEEAARQATAHTNVNFKPDPVFGVQEKDSSVIEKIIADHIETVGYVTTALAQEQAKVNEGLTPATNAKLQYEPIIDPATGEPVPVFRIIFEPDGTVKCLQNLPISPEIAEMLYNYNQALPLPPPAPPMGPFPSQAPPAPPIVPVPSQAPPPPPMVPYPSQAPPPPPMVPFPSQAPPPPPMVPFPSQAPPPPPMIPFPSQAPPPPPKVPFPCQAPFVNDNVENVPVPPPVGDISPHSVQAPKKVKVTTKPTKRLYSSSKPQASQVLHCRTSNCKKEFGDVRSRVYHERRCELRKFPCLSSECDKRFTSGKGRSDHVKRLSHGIKCSFPECDQMLNTPNQLKAHEKKCKFNSHVDQELDLKKKPVLTHGTEEENGINEYPNVNVNAEPVNFVTESIPPGGGGGADDSFDVVGILQEAFAGFSR